MFFWGAVKLLRNSLTFLSFLFKLKQLQAENDFHILNGKRKNNIKQRLTVEFAMINFSLGLRQEHS